MQGLERERLQEFAAAPRWYHSVDLGNGIITNGTYDHRPHLDRYGLPADLRGLSVLDVGTADGYFAFESEKRGAREVVALDRNRFDGTISTDVAPARHQIYADKYGRAARDRDAFRDVYLALDTPPGHQFLALKRLLGSKVEYVNGDAYKLDALDRKFDLVICGDLIEHLKHPLLALEGLAATTGQLCVIALSSAVRGGGSGLRARVGAVWSSLGARALGLPRCEPDRLVRYAGDGGGSFFHFTEGAFMRALRASGFGEVEVFARFDLYNRRHDTGNWHVIYHCRPL